jgi:hypothetical protein
MRQWNPYPYKGHFIHQNEFGIFWAYLSFDGYVEKTVADTRQGVKEAITEHINRKGN